ncbi:YciI family protein [Acuticoccus sediminis]|uniref:YciI family protein n=1 Tax=Acuticoccus sediminis TaxID=2184697 RepID=UPI001CFF15E6|nr:YciI family protein [Acuticoccus sediminis]
MPQYLVALHRPDGFVPDFDDEAMHRDIDALNEAMVAAGVRVFVGGLRPPPLARSLAAGPDGDVTVSDGPYLRAGEFVDGFWVLQCADLDEAVEWGRKAVSACRAPVEVRPFY